MSKRKILLADDSITIQKVVNLTFAEEGIDVVTVGDGDAALERLSTDVPDILLADVNMPGPTGYEICERLRKHEATQNLPVILLVGSFEPFDEAEASRVGANAYLTKPFQSIRQLIEQVNELIEASRAVASEAETVEIVEQIAEEPNPATTAETVPLPVIESVMPVLPSVEAEGGTSDGAEGTVESTETRYFDDLGYVSNIPPVASGAPPSDDIEDLYSQSISADQSAEVLSDMGLDDEMIETSYSAADANTDLANFAALPDAQADTDVKADPTREVHELPESDDSRESTASDIGFVSGYDQTFPEDPSRLENTIAYENWRPPDLSADPDSSSEMAAPVKAEGFPAEAQEAATLEQASQRADDGPRHVGEDTIRMENRFDTTGAAFKFDDADLLDLSPTAENPVEITSPADAVEQGGDKQLVTLSPELIEMIAQRVVEKLSEKY